MKELMKQYFKLECKPLKLVLTFLAMFLTGCLLLIFVNMMPEERIRLNIRNSVEMFEIQGNYPYMGVQETAYAADNWTEAVLMDIYYTADNAHPVYSAFVATEYRPENSTGVDRLVGVTQDAKWENSEKLLPRSCYWLGYGIFLRPLLNLFDYSHCRMLLNVVAYAVLMLMVGVIGKKLNWYTAVGFGTIMTIFHYYVLSLQYTLGIFCIFVAFAAIAYILYAKKEIAYLYFMFVIGILAAYFEWLSIPLVTFGLPVLFALVKKSENCENKSADLFNCVWQSGIGWCLGYGLMVLAKNVAAMTVIGNDAWKYFMERLSADSANSMTLREFVRAVLNLFYCVFPFNFIEGNRGRLLLIGIVVFVCVIILMRRKKLRARNLMLAIVGCAPIAWYIVFKGHVGHVGIEFRVLMISYLALWLILKEPLEELMQRKRGPLKKNG